MDPLARVGQPAPEFSLPDLEGREHRLSAARGQIVVLNFWSASCPHAERTDRLIAELAQGWRGRVVVWPIASNANETAQEIRQAAEARGLPLVLIDARHTVADAYGAVTTPHLYVVDTQGMLRYAGAPDDVTFRQRTPARHYLADAVAALLAGQDPEPAETPGYGCVIVRMIA